MANKVIVAGGGASGLAALSLRRRTALRSQYLSIRTESAKRS